jgi:hypothetical protein
LDSRQSCWNSSDKGRWCHSICPYVNNFPWFKHISASRNFICTFSRLISNHYICNSHLYRINIKDSNLCDCGEAYEDIDHIVFKCSRFILPRKKLIDIFKDLSRPIPESVRDILSRKYFPLLKPLFNFLNEISYFVWFFSVLFLFFLFPDLKFGPLYLEDPLYPPQTSSLVGLKISRFWLSYGLLPFEPLDLSCLL